MEIISEYDLRQYKDKAGVYFIQCYDGVIKIGCSSDVYTRLVSYQGVYW
jgi:predicted GIY-YIG superfamily endonuclease